MREGEERDGEIEIVRENRVMEIARERERETERVREMERDKGEREIGRQ